MNPGMILLPSKYVKVQQVLTQLCGKTGASTAILADTGGRLLCEAQPKVGPNTTILATLAASGLASTAEMGRLLGEDDHFRTLLYEGAQQNIYIAVLDSAFLIALVFDSGTAIEPVRLWTEQAIAQLTQERASLGALVGGELSLDFGQALAEELEHVLLG